MDAQLKHGDLFAFDHADLNLVRIRACFLIRRAVRVVEGKIVITRLCTWRALSFIAREPGSSPFNEPRLPNLS